eukprot:GHVU01130796.1.p2 GENE.GHVU01130796.1~~GHVU01130796.1.p2  ORF type:complete len:210 (-),score=50.37 GHVU01130796.1:95-640(-)
MCIALAAAPTMFTPERASLALASVSGILWSPGQLGVKTLDPRDYRYRGDYHNSNDSHDASVAHGANYHQGPEWVWPLGHLLEAELEFGLSPPSGGQSSTDATTTTTTKTTKKKISDADKHSMMRRLLSHRSHICHNEWLSLPELTNSNNSVCPDGCPAQAWSVATLLAFLQRLEESVTQSG